MPTNICDISTDLLNCTDDNSFSIKAPLNVSRECDPMPVDGLFVENCEDRYCDNRNNCSGEYYQPLKGKFYLQTFFQDYVNPDSELPLVGWNDGSSPLYYVSIELTNDCCEVVESDMTTFATEWMVGHNTENPYQNICIDIDSVPLDRFGFKICSYKLVDGVLEESSCLFTQCFEKARDCDVIEIEGEFCDSDCDGYYYGTSFRLGTRPGAEISDVVLTDNWVGTSNFAYSNKICIYAKLICGVPTISKELNSSSKTVSSTVTKNTILTLLKPIPCYMVNYLSKQLLGAENTIIDGQTFDTFTGSFSNKITKVGNETFLGDFTLTEDCETKFCC